MLIKIGRRIKKMKFTLKKTIWSVVILTIMFITLVGCTTKSIQQPTGNDDKLSLVATFFPLQDLTKSVVGNKGAVSAIVPPNTEPHDYEATPSDVQKLNTADAFITMGVEFAAFEDNLITSAGPYLKIIPAGKGVSQLAASDEEQQSQFAGKDPHIWLSPKNAKVMVKNIMDGLVSLDAKNSQEYINNANKIMQDLDTLDTEFKIELSQCQKHVVLVNHNAFSYLGGDYGFKTIYISGLDPEAEPTPGQIKALVDQARQYDLKYVLYEDLVDPRVANTIAHEVGAQTMKLDPLEGSSNPSDTYFTLMRKNLNTLKIALECK